MSPFRSKVIALMSLFLPCLVLVPAKAESHTLCAYSFHLHSFFEPFEGTVFQSLPGVRSDAKIRRLNQGINGGPVYRVFESTYGNESYIFKEYFEHEPRNNDLMAFDFLKNLLKGSTNIKVAKVLGHDKDRAMYIEDTRGQALDQILSDVTIPEELRAYLSQKYENALNEIRQKVKSHNHRFGYNNESRIYFQLFESNPVQLPSLEVFIKPDNIVVDARTLDLVIIDPF